MVSSEYPYVGSIRGLLGAVPICAALSWTAMRLAGSPNRYRRLIAFGIFWYTIALLPVSNPGADAAQRWLTATCLFLRSARFCVCA